MKISSASKKVLASALSAAMVVAFAPTVAFGAGQKVTVTVDANGGNASTGAYTIEANGTDAFVAPTATKSGYTFDHWYLDFNGDGEQNSSTETDIDAGNNVTIDGAFTGTEVTLRAVWKAPALGDATVTDYTNESNPAKIAIALSNFDSTAASLKKDTTYTVTVKNPNDVVVGTKVFEPAAKGAANEGYAYTADSDVTVQFKKVTDSTNKLVADLDYMVGGIYTAEISDGTQVVATKKVKVVRLTTVADDANKTETQHRFAEGTADVVTAASFTDENGFSVFNTSALKAGEIKWLAAPSNDFTVSGTSYAKSGRTLSFAVADTDASAGKKIDTSKADYAASIVDPSGAEIWSQKVTAAGTIAVTFDQTAAGNRAYSAATEKAGDYVLTVTETPKDGTKAVSAKAKVTLTEIKLSAGEHGSFKSSVKAADTDYFQVGTDFTTTASSLVDPAAGYDVKEWQLNGKAISATNAIAAGTVNEITVAYATTTKVQAPTVVSASYDKAKKQWTVKLATATAGAAIQVSTDGTNFSNYIDADGFTFAEGATAGNVKVKGVKVAGTASGSLVSDSDPVALAWSQNAFSGMVKGGSSDLEKYIGKSKVKFNAEPTIKAAIDAGQAALDAKGVDVSAEWDKLVKAQNKAVYEAVYAFATAELAKYADDAPVVTGDKAYTVSAKDLKTAQDAIEAANKVATSKTATAVTYDTQADAIVAALNTAIDTKATASKIAAADINAAAAVTEQLKAAKDADAAKAALEAYNKLTDAQKSLVATADVVAAQKIVADDENAKALAEAQDEAAIAAVKGKTVKAKAKKKTTASLKVVTSKSGAKSTFKKASGNAKITVSKGGKVTVKKGLKAGKKYVAKVKATVGTQAKTIKVVVKVAK